MWLKPLISYSLNPFTKVNGNFNYYRQIYLTVLEQLSKRALATFIILIVKPKFQICLVRILEINLSYLDMCITLPFHHRDPFDRVIISQSLIENIPIVSSDKIFDSYEIERIW